MIAFVDFERLIETMNRRVAVFGSRVLVSHVSPSPEVIHVDLDCLENRRHEELFLIIGTFNSRGGVRDFGTRFALEFYHLRCRANLVGKLELRTFLKYNSAWACCLRELYTFPTTTQVSLRWGSTACKSCANFARSSCLSLENRMLENVSMWSKRQGSTSRTPRKSFWAFATCFREWNFLAPIDYLS